MYRWGQGWRRVRVELGAHRLAYLLLSLQLLAGLVLGAAAPTQANAGGWLAQSGAELGAYLVEYLTLLPYAQPRLMEQLADFMLWNGLPLALLLLSGLYLTGLPLLLTILFLRAFVFGFTDAWLLSCGGQRLCLALALPQLLLLLLYARAARQSLSWWQRGRRRGAAGGGRAQLGRELRFCLGCLLTLLLIGLLQSYAGRLGA